MLQHMALAPYPPAFAATEPWREALRDAIREPHELCRLLDLPQPWLAAAERAARHFGLFAPRGFVDRMQRGDPQDPLLRQVLPVVEELTETPGYTVDPVGDRSAQVVPGLLRKYAGRALIVATGACAVHCRYCFRRHFPYAATPRTLDAWEPALAAIAADASLDEVILSGGDPLMLVDRLLAPLAGRLAAIPHLARLRIHTRLPIMIPERVTTRLLDWLRGSRLAPLVVVHANHAAELDDSVARALGKLVDAGVPVLNQTVLLRGVNDTPDTLVALCRRLVDLRVQPYYLHQLDRVAGSAHFEVPLARGRQIMRALHRRLPGYAVPRYVREVPGAEGKLPLAW
jgi:EF-P beta-lysylation protein EpmB